MKNNHASTAQTMTAYAFSNTSSHPPFPRRLDTTVQHADASALPLSNTDPSGEYAIVVTKIMCPPLTVLFTRSVLASTSTT